MLYRPKVVVETGTHQGYSATYAAEAMKIANIPGHIWTIDPFSLTHLWDNTDVAKYISWVRDYSTKAIGSIPEVVDFLILDSEHSFDTFSKEVELFEPRVREGGIIFLHDTLVFPEMSPVVHALHDSGRFELLTLETPRTYQLRGGGSGITLLAKRRNGPPITSDGYRISGETARQYYSRRNDPLSNLILATALSSDLDYAWPEHDR